MGVLKIFVLIAVSVALFCPYPIAAQSSMPKNEIIKSAPKQEGATTSSSPPTTGYHQKNPSNLQHTADKPVHPIAATKAIIENDTTKIKYDYEAQNLKIQRQLSESTKTIAYFTIFLVLVGISQAVIFWKQAHLLGETLNETKSAAEATNKSANAARDSADALPTLERAYIFVKNVSFIPPTTVTALLLESYNGGIVVDKNSFKVIVENYGKTPAIIKRVEGIGKVFTGAIPYLQGIQHPNTPEQIRIVAIQKDESFIFDFDIEDNETIDKVNSLQHKLVAIGCIQYEDIFGKLHETGFCWWYEPDSRDFYFLDHPGNYRT